MKRMGGVGMQGKEEDPLWRWTQRIELSLSEEYSVYRSIEEEFIPHSSPEEKAVILEIAEKWRGLSLEQLMQDEAVLQNIQLYKDVELLSARVYGFLQRLTKDILKEPITDQRLRLAAEFVRGEKLQYSYDRYFWQKRGKQLPPSVFDSNKQGKPIDTKTPQKMNEMLSSCKMLEKLYEFVVAIELVALEPLEKIANKFILSMERIGQLEQRSLYLDSLQIGILQDLRKAQKEKNQEQLICKK